MTVTIDQIKTLREKTGVSTMACKKALEEAGGDDEKALDLLRKKGEAKAASRSDRTTAHGVIAVSHGDGKSAMLAIGCETDFVAINEDFIAIVQTLADKLLAEGEDVDISEEIADLNIKMGEKIEVSNKKVVEGAHISTYVHMNKIGALISLSGGDEGLGKQLAMHITAANPSVLAPEDVDSAIVDKEKEIWIDQLKQEGKPENILEKIMEGKEKKFRETNALLTQNFVVNPEMKVKDLLGDIKVESFTRFAV